MKSDDLFQAIGDIREEFVQEVFTEPVARPKPAWAWFGLVAAAVLSLAVGGWWLSQRFVPKMTPSPSLDPSQTTSVETSESLAKIDVSLATTGPGTSEDLIMYYGQSGNPWTESANLSHFPVFINRTIVDQEHRVSQATIDQMKVRLETTAQRLGLPFDETAIESYAYPVYTSQEWEYQSMTIRFADYSLVVDSRLNLTIELTNPIVLPENLAFITNPSEESAIAVGHYLIDNYPELFGLNQPVVSVETAKFRDQFSYQLHIYDKGKDIVDDMINYWNGYSVGINGNQVHGLLNFWLDRTQILGDYPIIPLDQAKQRLLAGQFLTMSDAPWPKESDIVQVELGPSLMRDSPYYLPYYTFISRDKDGFVMHYLVPALTEAAAREVRVASDAVPTYKGLLRGNNRWQVRPGEAIRQEAPELGTQMKLPVLGVETGYQPDCTLKPKRLADMKQRLAQACQALGIRYRESRTYLTNSLPFWYLSYDDTNISYVDNSYRIVVGADLKTRIDFPDWIILPEGASLDKRATIDQLTKAADYVKTEYADLLGDNLVVAVESQPDASDRYQVFLYPDATDPIQKQLNYQLKRIELQGFGQKLSSLEIGSTDETYCLGNYPIISADQAKQRLLEGHYLSDYQTVVTADSQILQSDIVYRLTESQDMYQPFYRFLIPVDSKKADYQTYGAFYVSAIDPLYIQ